jgi:hypothetical protein
LIKRFFSSLRKPILAEQQSQIIGYVATITNEKVQVEALLSLIDQLPTSNQATLCFLMRQLKRVCSVLHFRNSYLITDKRTFGAKSDDGGQSGHCLRAGNLQ